MPDLLRPSEYDIIKTTLPLVAVLNCKSGGDRFAHFWHLPARVRIHINDYERPNRVTFGTEWKGQIDRFEIYKAENGGENLLVLAFSSITPVLQNIECLGQYYYGADVFARQPRAVSQALVAKVMMMSKERWSWKNIDPSDRQGLLVTLPLALVGIVAWLGVFFAGSEIETFMRSQTLFADFLLFVGYAIALLIGTAIGICGSGIFLVYNWVQFRKRRSALADTLAWYEGHVVIR